MGVSRIFPTRKGIIIYTVRILFAGNPTPVLVVKDCYGDCMTLAHALTLFERDVISVTVYTTNELQKEWDWVSPVGSSLQFYIGQLG